MSKLCVDKCVSKLCVSKLCGDKLCVCVCVQVVCVSKRGAAERRGQAGPGGAGQKCTTKNKNPTQRCGEKGFE